MGEAAQSELERACTPSSSRNGSTLELVLPPADLHAFAQQVTKAAAPLVTPTSESKN